METGELQALETAAIQSDPQMDAQVTPDGPSRRVRFMSPRRRVPLHAVIATRIVRLL